MPYIGDSEMRYKPLKAGAQATLVPWVAWGNQCKPIFGGKLHVDWEAKERADHASLGPACLQRLKQELAEMPGEGFTRVFGPAKATAHSKAEHDSNM